MSYCVAIQINSIIIVIPNITNEEGAINNHMMELIVVSDTTLCSELSVLSLPQILGSF